MRSTAASSANEEIAMLTFERVEELQCTFRGLREQRGADLRNALS